MKTSETISWMQGPGREPWQQWGLPGPGSFMSPGVGDTDQVLVGTAPSKVEAQLVLVLLELSRISAQVEDHRDRKGHMIFVPREQANEAHSIIQDCLA